MAFIGVRMSWDMLLKNVFRASPASFACWSASSSMAVRARSRRTSSSTVRQPNMICVTPISGLTFTTNAWTYSGSPPWRRR